MAHRCMCVIRHTRLNPPHTPSIHQEAKPKRTWWQKNAPAGRQTPPRRRSCRGRHHGSPVCICICMYVGLLVRSIRDGRGCNVSTGSLSRTKFPLGLKPPPHTARSHIHTYLEITKQNNTLTSNPPTDSIHPTARSQMAATSPSTPKASPPRSRE